MFFQMHQVLRISNLCLANPTLIHEEEKNKANRCNRVTMYLLLVGYLSAACAITVALALSNRQSNTKFLWSVVVCYCMELIAYTLLLTSGLTSVIRLKRQYGD
jgi:hypothetical protein